jgi:hypothetical protein
VGLEGLEFESLVFGEGLGFEALVSETPRIRGVVSEALGLRRSWASAWASNCWARMRLIHGPTVTPQFPCLEDYGNLCVLHRMDQTLKAYPNSGDSKAFEACLYEGTCWSRRKFFLNFDEYIWAGKFLNFPAKKFRDALVARGGVDHLMRRFQWSRFGHVSDSEWSYGRPSVSVIMTANRQKLKHFRGFRSVFLGFKRTPFQLPMLTPRFPLIAYKTQT